MLCKWTWWILLENICFHSTRISARSLGFVTVVTGKLVFYILSNHFQEINGLAQSQVSGYVFTMIASAYLFKQNTKSRNNRPKRCITKSWKLYCDFFNHLRTPGFMGPFQCEHNTIWEQLWVNLLSVLVSHSKPHGCLLWQLKLSWNCKFQTPHSVFHLLDL